MNKLDSPLVQWLNHDLATASFNTIHTWDIAENNGTFIHEINAKDESGRQNELSFLTNLVKKIVKFKFW